MTDQAWWVQRWLELLDSYRFKKRLERARLYAREGNVLNIDFEGSRVLARVQGSEPEPYQVSLSLEPFRDEDWDYVIDILSRKAIYSARLLAGQMPENIERVFIESGVNLFPFSLSDIRSRCTCPDKANPCKHIGAVYYQLADRFREDPFVLFQLRGRTKERILEELRQKRSRKTENTPEKAIETADKPNLEPAPAELPTDPALFWRYEESLDPSLVVIIPPADDRTVLDILGTFPLAPAEADSIEQFLKPIYRQMAQEAMATALQREE
ncbi:SWIM zinc finger family protein [Pannus brasiliensis CCIBt3594]|uniref:SWIM zinc finger family protein n=1 Tax=Pannus brasiliensis CCIBt3594 TaxID=1427578 RepID=A0AAW9QZ70_9CHRO